MNKQFRYLIISALLFLVGSVRPLPGWSQEHHTLSFFSNLSTGARGYYGSFITSHSKAEYIRDSYSSFGEIYLERQTDGSKDWHISHRYPKIGFAFLYGNTGSRQYIGNLHALYTYMNVTISHSKNYTGSIRFGGGTAWVSKPFDINTNPKNTLIGARFNAFITAGWQHSINISPHVTIDAAVNFMHLSNGGTSLPNLGLNIAAFSTGLRYTFSKLVKEEKILPVFVPQKFKYSLYTSAAIEQWPWVGSKHYLVNALQAEFSKQKKYNHSIGAGVALFYNRTLTAIETDAGQQKKRLQAGVYGCYEYLFGKLSIPLQAGIYMYNRDDAPYLFQQLGLRFRAAKHISAEILLKTHMGKADFIHAGIGYNF